MAGRTISWPRLLLWSSMGERGYAVGVSRSETGLITGPWIHDPVPLWAADGGHAMLFNAFDGQLILTFHRPNVLHLERPAFFPVAPVAGSLRLSTPNETGGR
jgi:arabinan endo-1,5-alpha-L-arabinosidase